MSFFFVFFRPWPAARGSKKKKKKLTELLVRPHDAKALPVLAAEGQREGDVDGLLLGGRGRAARRFQGGSAAGGGGGDEAGGRRAAARCCRPGRVVSRRLFSGRGRRRAGARLALLLVSLVLLLLLLLLSRRRGRGRRRRRGSSRRRRRSGRPKCCLLLLLLACGGIRSRNRGSGASSLASSCSLRLRHDGFFPLCFELFQWGTSREGVVSNASEREREGIQKRLASSFVVVALEKMQCFFDFQSLSLLVSFTTKTSA